MIVVLTTAAHRYTHAPIQPLVPGLRRMPYSLLFASRSLPVATYIFTDVDRLGFWEIELAASCHRQLSAAGCRVLNDPARMLHRLALLRRLHRDGINQFAAWSAHDIALVDRFPVFIRTEHAHRGVLSAPLATPAELAIRLEELVADGRPLADLMIVEYCAEPVREGLFRKPSVQRVGRALIAIPSVHQAKWTVKQGDSRVATVDEYADDLATIEANPYADIALRACETAAIEYGRVDIGVVGGAAQVYEINTNPMTPAVAVTHWSPLRVEAFARANERYAAAMADIDTPRSRARVRITPPVTRPGRKRLFRIGPRLPIAFDVP